MARTKRRDEVIKSLTLETNKEMQDTFAVMNNMQPIALSCGGIYIPHQRFSEDVREWKQIVNLPGDNMQACLFGFSPEAPSPLDIFLFRESSN